MKDKSKFRMIADQFRYMIRSGELASGAKFYTRKELCCLYSISSMTAFHVQEELQNDGLITKVPGIGFFVNCPEMHKSQHSVAPVKKISMIGSPQAVGEEAEFGSLIVKSAQELCRQKNIDFKLELVQVLNNPARIINTSRRLEFDEALMVMLHSDLLPEIVNLMMAPDVRCVSMLRSFPGKTAVLPDWSDAARKTTDFLKKRNVKKFLYIGQCSLWQFPQHETEMYENFSKYSEEFCMETDFSGNFQEVCRHIEMFAPEALVFSHSDAAVHFADAYFESINIKRPLLTGYGHAVSHGKEKTLDAVYFPDAAEMGKKAVELLLEPDLVSRVPMWQRVTGNLIEYN